MTNRHDTERLSDYLDGELRPEEQAQVEAHLAACRECAATLEDLRAVATAAGRLPPLPPERDLWPDIEDRLDPRGGAGDDPVIELRTRRRVVMTVPQLIAAVLALMIFSASAVWLTVGGTADTGSEPVIAATDPALTPVAFTDFDQAMTTLEAEYRSRRAELDPETIRVVERNLAIIDRAIEEARAALLADPSSGFLNGHLANAMRQKMDLLRRAATIAQSEI